MESKATGIVKGRFRPHNHIGERNNQWKSFPLLSPLRERFSWSRHGQPTLEELINASYQALVEKGPQLNFEETPTKFTFINPSLSL